jgi:transcriptional regulator with XRE-family HTH domain
MTFGKRLSVLREQKKITQSELAKLTDISRSRLSLYETNKREPDFETLKQLSDFFNVSTDYLLGQTDIQNPQQTIAAHRTDDSMDDLPEEALKSIEDFKKFIYQKHGIKYD